jgi:hypothetical protein
MRPGPRTFALASILVLATAAPARAGGIVGDGTPGSCTEAALDARLGGGGTVTFACGASPVTIPITATKVITTTTGIDGGGRVTLDGGGTTRLFLTTYQFSPFIFDLRNLTLRSGHAADFGGAIRLAYQEPANWTTLNVTNVSFVSNVAAAAGNDVGGGAIYALGGYVNVSGCSFTGNRGGNGGAIGNLQAVFDIRDSTFTGNATQALSGGGGGNGGAIYVDGSSNSQLAIRRTAFVQNSSTNLGGAIHIYQYAGSSGLLIEDSTFDRNTTVNNGGALYHQNGNLTIDRATFVGNTTVGQGGAIWLLQSASATLTNCTFSGNRANGYRPNTGSVGLGGAILINDQANVTISHTTIVGNFADWVGGGICGGLNANTSITLRATIVANNSAANGGNPWNIAHNCSNQLLNGGFNIQYPDRNHNDGNDPYCTPGVWIVEPGLSALASNGGYTQTMPPNPGSPALDLVTSGCPPPSVDQRGRARPEGTACDAGSVEGGPDILFFDGFESGDLSRWSGFFPLGP